MFPLLLLALPGLALAAEPAPDRPSVARTGRLVGSGSLELEAGVRWAGAFSAPALMKYSVRGAVEPRVGMDLAGLGAGGDPDLTAGAKIRIYEDPDLALSTLLQSAVPVQAHSPWSGTARMLFDFSAGEHLDFRLNTGLDLDGSGGRLHVLGVPLVARVGTPLGRSVDLWGETACRVWDGVGEWVVDGGLSLRLTEIATLDAAGGWEISAAQPFATVGLTANLGRVGG